MHVGGGASASPLGVVQTHEYEGIQRGDYVHVDGRKGTWRFCYHTVTASGQEWVTVYGGSSKTDGAQQFVSVFPHQIRRKSKQPDRRAG